MDRRSYLKASLALGGSLMLPAGVLALVGCSGTMKTPGLAGFDGRSMGTGYSVRFGGKQHGITINGAPVDQAKIDQLAEKVHAMLLDVDTHMSTWRADSELSQFNASANTDWQPLSAPTLRVIAQALDTSADSNGAFDVTVGPLVDLWGFGAGAETSAGGDRKPAGSDIVKRLAQVGYGAIDIDLTANAARKRNPHTRLDLSGIAKGHAVDRVAALLDQEGLDSYLVEVGGELKSRGRKPDNTAWKVAIERPSVGRREAFRALELKDLAIATSGDYRNFFDDAGQRYSHSIDPRTGKPVSHQLASVSVVAGSTMAADALSTALMILGPDEAMDFAIKHQVAAHLIVKSGSALKEVYTPAFEPLVS